MANGEDNKKRFILDLSQFYNLFLGNTAQAVLKLADIQEKFDNEYKALKELQLDPSKLDKYIENLSDEDKGFLLGLFTKAASFEARLKRLFELSVAEKKGLAKDINDFSAKIEKKMQENAGEATEEGEV